LNTAVRTATPEDATAWLRLRCALWPHRSAAEHREEIDRFFAGQAAEPSAVLLAKDGAGGVLGLAELSIRPYAEGCTSDRVGYLEGWFVRPEARRLGVGRALVAAAEQRARARVHRRRNGSLLSQDALGGCPVLRGRISR